MGNVMRWCALILCALQAGLALPAAAQPPSAAIPFPFVADWNAANPATPIRIPFNLREWASMNAGAVPMFYLMRSGRVAGSLAGWPPEGNRAALLDLLDGRPVAMQASMPES